MYHLFALLRFDWDEQYYYLQTVFAGEEAKITMYPKEPAHGTQHRLEGTTLVHPLVDFTLTILPKSSKVET